MARGPLFIFASAMLQPTLEQRGRPGAYTVLVSSVSPGATAATLREFFSFAGPVSAVELASELEGGLQQGHISFLSAQGAETALLLDGALIVDRPINIHAPPDAPAPLLDRLAGEHETASMLEGDASLSHLPRLPRGEDHGGGHRVMGAEGLPGAMPEGGMPAGAPDASYPDGAGAEGASGAIASLIAAGYKLGQRAFDFLSHLEEAHGRPAASAVALIREGADAVRVKVAEVDEANKISATVKAFDEEHEITERASAMWTGAVESARIGVESATPLAVGAAEAVRETAGQLSARARDDPNVGPVIESSWSAISSSLAGVSDWAHSTWLEVTTEVARATDASPAAERRSESARPQPSSLANEGGSGMRGGSPNDEL